MRINNTGADFAAGAQNGVGAARPAPTANGAGASADSDEVVLSQAGSAASSAIQAVVNADGYEPDSLLTAGRIVDSALVKID